MRLYECTISQMHSQKTLATLTGRCDDVGEPDCELLPPKRSGLARSAATDLGTGGSGALCDGCGESLRLSTGRGESARLFRHNGKLGAFGRNCHAMHNKKHDVRRITNTPTHAHTITCRQFVLVCRRFTLRTYTTLHSTAYTQHAHAPVVS
jgi:hypothetical protein